ncbi:MAG: hypothetical protein Q7T71_17000, partial [Herbiconiux sp.]|nr:hypothetical protein [Herbiconiux sp.]
AAGLLAGFALPPLLIPLLGLPSLGGAPGAAAGVRFDPLVAIVTVAAFLLAAAAAVFVTASQKGTPR